MQTVEVKHANVSELPRRMIKAINMKAQGLKKMGRLHPKAKNAGSLESSLVRIAGLKSIMEKK